MNIEVSTVGDRIQSGQGTVGATRQILATKASTERLKRGVTIKAATGNANSVCVGGPEVSTSNGFILLKDESVFIACESVEQVYVVGGAADQAYHWIAI